MTTPGILSRVFLFYFEKISDHFSIFRVFWDISVNTGRNSKFGRYEVCALKKKNFLKTKTNLHFVHPKTSKGKKKIEKKINEQRLLTINYKFVWNSNKIINYCCLVVLLICLSFINYNLLYYCFISYEIINCYLA